MLIVDGVYTFDDEAPRFHRLAAPTQTELQRLLHAIATRVTRAFERHKVRCLRPVSGRSRGWCRR